ncbi:MAG: hypothetical protein AAF800_02700 [Planctomycetota bacterium]
MSAARPDGAVEKFKAWWGRYVGGEAVPRRLCHRWFRDEAGYRGRVARFGDVKPDRPEDFVWQPGPPPPPDEAFARLRWGGQLLVTHGDDDTLLRAARAYAADDGFEVEAGPRATFPQRFGIPLPLFGRRLRYLLLRKVTLLRPGEDTDRFTFDVRLVRRPELGNRYVVMKQVPRYRRVVARLHNRFPEAPQTVLLERAEKLVKRVFPVFLTREAGFLQLLNRDLPAEYRGRVPEALGFERAADGTIKRLYMTWLRLGVDPVSHLDFAKQAAELLSVLHDRVGVIHLDLRLDNVLICDGRVCFIDFGSSVRVGENIAASPLLSSLFEEMANTSRIQRTMGRMRDAGRLTSDVLVAAHGKLDKGVDMFYLSLQISKPVSNPDLRPLIGFEPGSEVAKRIKLMTGAILRPSDPNRPHFISAADVLGGLRRIEAKLEAAGESTT